MIDNTIKDKYNFIHMIDKYITNFEIFKKNTMKFYSVKKNIILENKLSDMLFYKLVLCRESTDSLIKIIPKLITDIESGIVDNDSIKYLLLKTITTIEYINGLELSTKELLNISTIRSLIELFKLVVSKPTQTSVGGSINIIKSKYYAKYIKYKQKYYKLKYGY